MIGEKMEYKIGIIGKFGANQNMYDGQTVKTKNLANLLQNTGRVEIFKIDTCYFRKRNVKLMLDTLKGMLLCKHIFLMVSVNGMRFYLPFLYWLNKIARRHIYHYIIGSELLEMVREDPGLVRYLNALSVNWFEYESGTRFLESSGVKNVHTLSNFKLLTPVPAPTEYQDEAGIYRFCTFSRVMEEKGITEAIEAVRSINEKMGRVVAVLDIYGPVEACYEKKLDELLAENSNCAAYRGVVDSQSSVDVLKDYYALLFPTRWPGEGVPGTVIDAFAAGIPIIASDWNANREIIDGGKQGLLYPNEIVSTLEDAVYWSVCNPDVMQQMRICSREEFVKYMPDTILNVILNEMEKNELER